LSFTRAEFDFVSYIFINLKTNTRKWMVQTFVFFGIYY